jgi:hypothetical protein
LGVGLNTAKSTRLTAATIKDQQEGELDANLLTATGQPIAFKITLDGQRDKGIGKLTPFSVTRIHISCLNIMAGDFSDTVSVQVINVHCFSYSTRLKGCRLLLFLYEPRLLVLLFQYFPILLEWDQPTVNLF